MSNIVEVTNEKVNKIFKLFLLTSVFCLPFHRLRGLRLDLKKTNWTNAAGAANAAPWAKLPGMFVKFFVRRSRGVCSINLFTALVQWGTIVK